MNESTESSVSPRDLMDDYIDQFTPEEFGILFYLTKKIMIIFKPGMAIHLLEQQNEDILLLF